MENVGEKRLVSEWEAITKDNEGEAHIHTLHKFEYAPDPVDEALFISQAAPTIIRPSRRVKPAREDELTLVFGDAQIGYRGEEAFHSERSMMLAQTAIRELMPDRVIYLGDMLDLPNMSRFEQRADWQGSTQKSLDRYHTFLSETRANAPNAEIVTMEGNHEVRMERMLRKDAADLMHIRRANAEKELGVLTLQFLLRMDELEVNHISGYPNGVYWLNDNMKAIHGTNVAKGGSNAAKYLRDEMTSTLFGHTHRVEMANRTIPTRTGSKTIVAASPGALASNEGHIPGHRYTTDNRNNTVLRAEDWQAGMLMVQTTKTAEHVTPVVFHGNEFAAWGRIYRVEDQE